MVYVGESRHLQRRVREHVDGEWGGKFTSAHPPVELLEYESVDSGDETDEKGFAETFHDPPQTFVYSDVMEY
ncbi:hypothetical protein C446_01193 [Halobiforma nitratireducens JCM 10879]|uniref:GIY-YIG domain-containing protein n=1 Tax=Halobiforma nitratireducens JCM 10879 TaxID=1227454 RepID=M0ML71_9EURY|nr:hypothetical protein C446_01193 [Halobiforma nitratireducens JCM 10879]